MRSLLKGFVPLRATAAGICLIAYLVAMGVFPVCLGLAATVEGTHAVSLTRTSDHLAVVLHHRAASSGMAYEHRHGSTSRLVCLLGSSPAPQEDHIASFASNLACETTSGEFKLKEPGLSSFLTFDPVPAPVSPLPASFQATVTTPSTSAACLCGLRTTVLLI
jgi:hypothetical protein